MEEYAKEYVVVWKIEIVAKSPKDAAEQALTIQRDTNSQATVFDVKEVGKRERFTRIDLLDVPDGDDR